MMAGKKRPRSSSISIGDCKVEIEGIGVDCELKDKNLILSVSNGAKIKISADQSRKHTDSIYNTLPSRLNSVDDEACCHLDDLSFVHVNPKDEGKETKSLLQEVLLIYMHELPSMNYAANTGKESLFLERCVSTGKYRTLILKSNSIIGPGQVMAAVSYQIVPTDTRFAEVPVAAVCSKYQKKGFGHLLYMELRERLRHVGISTIFCWADQESEGFWLKQGFDSVGKVNSKGKARRLPIKADIRKSLSFPGGSTLMVANVSSELDHRADIKMVDDHAHLGIMSADAPKISIIRKDNGSLLLKGIRCSKGLQHAVENEDCPPFTKKVQCSWETSLSSLNSKRVRGGHLTSNQQNTNQDLANSQERCTDTSFGHHSFSPSSKNSGQTTTGYHDLSIAGSVTEILKPRPTDSHLASDSSQPIVMFMNIADESKKRMLAKIVKDLGGTVTCIGSSCTHVITGKARRTMNFCTALCSGAWVVSPKWLKACFREGRFVGESDFILNDEEYRLKHKSHLSDAVVRAKNNPHALLEGYHICLAKHIQPSTDILSAIINSAGGTIVRKLEEAKELSRTIFLACEEDMSEALAASKKGIWTFSSEWLMNSVMKQELDLDAPQFTESL